MLLPNISFEKKPNAIDAEGPSVKEAKPTTVPLPPDEGSAPILTAEVAERNPALLSAYVKVVAPAVLAKQAVNIKAAILYPRKCLFMICSNFGEMYDLLGDEIF